MRGLAIDATLGALADGTRGVFLSTDARAKGVNFNDLEDRARAGRVTRLHRGIWRLTDHPWTWQAQLQAALFDAGPGAVVALRSAARLHGFYAYRESAAVEVTRPRVDVTG